MSRAAIVLCGGHSKRMGRDKASLPFGDESLLARVIGIVSKVTDEVWVVSAKGSEAASHPSAVSRDVR